MAHSKGNSPSNVDYNTYIGTTGVTSAYASSVAATQKVAALLGVGFGDRGYGQSTPLLTAVSQGDQIKAVDWLNLSTAIANIATQQGTSTSLLPPSSEFVTGKTIVAEVIATTPYDFPTIIANIDTNRNIAAAGGMSLTSNALTITRATTWGSGSTGITCTASATFSSEDSARYFFNSGGALNLILAHPSVATTQDSNWNTILSALGTVSFSAHNTTRSGSGGTPATVGYYELTTTPQTILNGANIGTGSYTANGLLIEAWATAIPGVNGGKGTVINLRITLTDGHINAFSDVVASGTNCVFGFKKATVNVAGIATPAIAQVTSF